MGCYRFQVQHYEDVDPEITSLRGTVGILLAQAEKVVKPVGTSE